MNQDKIEECIKRVRWAIMYGMEAKDIHEFFAAEYGEEIAYLSWVAAKILGPIN